MVRDGVANIVGRLHECGFEPRRVGGDAWKSRCPAHRGREHALSITRNEFNHVVLTCQSAFNCTHINIILRSIGIDVELRRENRGRFVTVAMSKEMGKFTTARENTLFGSRLRAYIEHGNRSVG